MSKKLVLNRDYTLVTTKGHTIRFQKGKPTHVPKEVFADAVAIGALAEDGSDPNIIKDEVAKKVVDSADRAPLIRKALEKIVAVNKRADFTAAGIPTEKAVEREVGFDVDKRELNEVWNQMHEDEEAGK